MAKNNSGSCPCFPRLSLFRVKNGYFFWGGAASIIHAALIAAFHGGREGGLKKITERAPPSDLLYTKAPLLTRRRITIRNTDGARFARLLIH